MPGNKAKKEIIEKWLNGASRGKIAGDRMSIDGDVIYSYQTKIARKDGNTIFLNNKNYSMTTSAQQKIIKVFRD